MGLHRKKEEERKGAELKNEVKLLKRRHDANIKRDDQIRADINSGTRAPAASYRLPLSALPPAPQARAKAPGPEHLASLRAGGFAKQQLLGHALAHGVTCWPGEAGEQVVNFDPFVAGRHHGPYELRLKVVEERLVVKGHSLPHEVPLREVQQAVTEQEKGRGVDLVRPLVLAVGQHLRAVLSRQGQIQEMKDKYPEEVQRVVSGNGGTSLSVFLTLEVEGEAARQELRVDLTYDRAGEWPRTVAVQAEGEEEEQRDWIRRCRAFTRLPLAAALAKAFSN